MNKNKIKQTIKDIRSGKLSPKDAYIALKHLPYEDIGFAKIDHHRSMRKGFPEIIYCEGKTTNQIISIVKKMAANGSDIIGTRASEEVYLKAEKHFPNIVYYQAAKILSLKAKSRSKRTKQFICVVTAGTADIPVAEEAAVTAELLGNNVERIYDVGVAGIHRLFDKMKAIQKASVLIVVAGMEGALASVVGGMVDIPVIAVPTSVCYGANFKGLSALLAMMNSCAPGISVVNIDNGFGAACCANAIMRLKDKK